MHARGREALEDRDAVAVQGGRDGGGSGLEGRAPGVPGVLGWHRAVDAVGQAVHDAAAGECGERGCGERIDGSKVRGPYCPHRRTTDEAQGFAFRTHHAEVSLCN